MQSGTLVFPDALKPGDTIGLVSPAFPIKAEERDLCVKMFEDMGYRVLVGGCLEKLLNFHSYLAGDAMSRAEDINRMFRDPEVKAIFCVRGGYGSSHIMRYLDFEMIKKNPKIFVGYSDITNMHSGFQMFCNLVTFHGPMACSNMLNDFDEYTRESLWRTLNMDGKLEFLNPPGDDGFHVIREGRAEGMLAGGNLSLVARGCGTFFQLDGKGKILFLEDVDETVPALDMYITQMEYAGVFDGVRGILLGDFTDCTNEKYDGTYAMDSFLRDRFAQYEIPVMCHVRSGHDKPMGTLPMGAGCHMDAAANRIWFYRS